jgi:hypothetical protein
MPGKKNGLVILSTENWNKSLVENKGLWHVIISYVNSILSGLLCMTYPRRLLIVAVMRTSYLVTKVFFCL